MNSEEDVSAGFGIRIMKLLPELKAAYRFSIKGVVAKLTLIMSVMSCVRLAVDIFHISLLVHFWKLTHLYQAIFHASLAPVFKLLPSVPPAYVKDSAILYFLIGFIFQKVVFVQIKMNYHNPGMILHDFKDSKLLYLCKASLELIKVLVFWPIYMQKSFRTPFLVVSHGSQGRTVIRFTASGEVNGEPFAYLGDSRLMMLIRLAAIIFGTLRRDRALSEVRGQASSSQAGQHGALLGISDRRVHPVPSRQSPADHGDEFPVRNDQRHHNERYNIPMGLGFVGNRPCRLFCQHYRAAC